MRRQIGIVIKSKSNVTLKRVSRHCETNISAWIGCAAISLAFNVTLQPQSPLKGYREEKFVGGRVRP